jgi:N utilization substance protein B
MPSRRQIREAVVQFLYCADLDGDGDPAALRDSFWDVVTESDRRRHQRTTLWTLHQLSFERDVCLVEFGERQLLANKIISAWTQAESLKIDLNQISELEADWSRSFAKLARHNMLDGNNVSAGDCFDETWDALYKLDRDLADARRRFLESLEYFPALRRQLEAVAEKIRQLVAESDARSQQLATSHSHHATQEEQDGERVPFDERTALANTLLSAWQLYCRRRRRRVPRATASTILSEWPQAESLKTTLHCIAELESGWTIALAKLDRLPKDDDDVSEAASFGTALDGLFLIDRELSTARCRFLKDMEDFPALRGPFEGIAAIIRRLQCVSERVRMVKEPEKFPEQEELARLCKSKAKINKLRQKANELVDSILSKKELIDDVIAGIVENFTSERIDPVDRAILRLATHEILHAATPPKVAINEAIELAKRFGTTDSQRFVNGVLDRIAKLAPNGSTGRHA